MINRTVGFFVMVCGVLLCGIPAAGAQSAASTETAVSTAAVVLAGEEIFVVRERLLSLSAEERAERISARIHRIASDPLRNGDKISLNDGENATDIMVDDVIVMSVTDKDAKREGIPRVQLAENLAARIKAALSNYKRDYNYKTLISDFAYAALLTILLLLLGHFLNRSYNKFVLSSGEWARVHIKGLIIQKTEIVPAERIIEIYFGALRVLRLTLVVILLYFYVPLVLSLFPWTRSMSSAILGYVLDPLQAVFKGVIGYVPNLFFVLVVIVCVQYFIKLLHVIAVEIKGGRISLPNFYPDWAEPTFLIIRFMLWAFTLVIVFPYLPGSSSPVFKGVSVFLGVLFSLGSSSAIANGVAGVILTYMRPFKVGDRVKISDTIGDVVEKGLLVTRVKTIKNVYITVPNALVMGSHMINYSSLSANEGLILNTTVTIGYDAPWPKVHELLIAAASATDNILADPKPFVLQTKLNDYNVSYELNAYTDKPSQMAALYSALHQNIQDGFNAAGIEIMSPGFTAIRDGNAVAIPREQWRADYKPSSFVVGIDMKKEGT